MMLTLLSKTFVITESKMSQYRIALIIAASSGMHKTIGRALLKEFMDGPLSLQYSIDTFFTGLDSELIAQQVNSIFDDGYDILITVGYISARVVSECYTRREPKFLKTKTVFTAAKWPVEQGIIKSIKRPGKSMTGIMREGQSPLMQSHFIEHISELAIKKILIPYTPTSEGGYLIEQSRLIKLHLEEVAGIEVDVASVDDAQFATATIEPYLKKGLIWFFFEGCTLGEAIAQLCALCQEYGVYLFW